MTYSHEEGIRYHQLSIASAAAGTYQSKPYTTSVIDSIDQFLRQYPRSIYTTGVYSFKLDLVSSVSSDGQLIGAIADSLLQYDPMVQTKLGVADVFIRKNINAARGAGMLHEILPQLTIKSQQYQAFTLLAQYDMAHGDKVSAKADLLSALRIDSTRDDAWFRYLAFARAQEDQAEARAIQRQIARLEDRDLLQFSEASSKSTDLFKDLSACTFTDMEGRSVPLAAYQNKIVVLDFFAFWCGACFPELPNSFRRLSREFPDVCFLYVNASGPDIGGTPNDVKKHFLSKPKFKFLKTQKLLFPPADIGKMLDITAVPTTLIIDKHGIVRFEYQGYTKGAEDTVRKNLQHLANEK